MFILFKFYHVRAGARTHARQFYFECWKFTENPKIEEFSENMILARARARIKKIWIKTRDFKENRNL